MTFSLLKPMLKNTYQKCLCVVLAAIVTLCSVMIAVPGFYQSLSGHTLSTSCHSPKLTETAHLSGHGGALADAATMPIAADNEHHSSASICGGEFLSAESTTNLSPVFSLLFVTIIFTAVVSLSLATLLQLRSSSVGLGPPYSDRLRSHLGLGRIHI